MADVVVKLYTISDDKDHIEKSLGTALELNCTIKEQTSVQDPVIRINSTSNLSGYNYAYIQRYGRYYYIRDIKVVPNNFWEITMHSDVLMSRKSQIRALEGTITRSESLYNAYLPDPEYKSLAYRQTVTKVFPNEMADDSFILVTIG